MFVVRIALKLCVLILIKQVMYSFYAFISVWIHGFLFFFWLGYIVAIYLVLQIFLIWAIRAHSVWLLCLYDMSPPLVFECLL